MDAYRIRTFGTDQATQQGSRESSLPRPPYFPRADHAFHRPDVCRHGGLGRSRPCLRGANAQTAAETPLPVSALSIAPPAKLIESCTSVIDNPATPEADRLDAMVTRAVALQIAARATRRPPRSTRSLPRIRISRPGVPRPWRSRPAAGKIDAAFERFTKRSSSIPKMPSPFESRGNAFNNTKKFDRAIEDYNEALRLKPDYAQAYCRSRRGLVFQGRIPEGDRRLRSGDPAGAGQREGLHQPRLGLSQDRPHRPGTGRRYRGDPDRSDRSGLLRQSRPASCGQWRLYERDRRLQ